MPKRAENNHANSQSQVRLWLHHTVCTELPNKYEFRKAFKNLNHSGVLRYTNQLAAEVKVHGEARQGQMWKKFHPKLKPLIADVFLKGSPVFGT